MDPEACGIIVDCVPNSVPTPHSIRCQRMVTQSYSQLPRKWYKGAALLFFFLQSFPSFSRKDSWKMTKSVWLTGVQKQHHRKPEFFFSWALCQPQMLPSVPRAEEINFFKQKLFSKKQQAKITGQRLSLLKKHDF